MFYLLFHLTFTMMVEGVTATIAILEMIKPVDWSSLYRRKWRGRTQSQTSGTAEPSGETPQVKQVHL